MMNGGNARRLGAGNRAVVSRPRFRDGCRDRAAYTSHRRCQAAPRETPGAGHGCREAGGAAMLEILFEHIHLPTAAVGVAHPELRLPGVAARDAVLASRAESVLLEAALHADERFGCRHAESQMVER